MPDFDYQTLTEVLNEARHNPSFDYETLDEFLGQAQENPRFSRESERVNFFYEMSMESSAYAESTGDAGEWIRHAVLFRFESGEAAWLEINGLIEKSERELDGSLEIGFSVDDCGFPSVINKDEYRNIRDAYNDYLREQEEAEAEKDADALHEQINDRLEEIQEELRENNGHCKNCNACMINGVYCHESGCITGGEVKRLKMQLQQLEESV